MRKRGKSLVVFVVFLAIVALLGYYALGIVRGTMHKDNEAGIKLGLDLAGGVSITYQVKGEEAPSKEDMDDTIYKLQKRVQTYSTEAQVYQVGDDRITCEIPGVSNANEILEELGSPGSLVFMTEDQEVIMTGNEVTSAEAATTQDQATSAKQYVVQLKFSEEGTKKWGDATTANVGKKILVVFDNEIISQPVVKQAITGGECVIEGMADFEEASALASQIRIGSLTLELEELQSEVVGAQLGTDAISTSIKAAMIGVLIVMIFMIAVYWIPGLAASIALLIYTGIVLSLLHLYDITLTLPGIAGIILSIGMAVDANVVIFARIREETAAGRTVDQAIKIGFKKARSAIIDSNITTLIAAVVLGLRGSGSVRGFAATLAIGVIVSMFTALFITRWILGALYGMGIQDIKFYGKKKARRTIDFVKRRLIFFLIPICLIVIGFAGMGVHSAKGDRPFNFSLEFMGGTSSTVAFDKDYSLAEIDETIVPGIEKITGDANVQAQKVEGSNSVVFKTRTLTLDEREEFNTLMQKNYGVKEEGVTYNNISSTVSGEMRNDAIWAVIIATLCMLVYIWFRFKDIRFASAAVIALVHDVLILLTFYALSRTSVGTTFIACMLTIVGYSINSTIVIFDRIREHLKNDTIRSREDLKGMVNLSINQTLTRSINTNITSLITMVALFILGVSSIREFSGPLIVGLIAGAYSSVFVTGSLWYIFRGHIGNKYPSTGKSDYLKRYAAAEQLVAEKNAAAGGDAGEIVSAGVMEKSDVNTQARVKSEITGKKKKRRNKTPEDKTVV